MEQETPPPNQQEHTSEEKENAEKSFYLYSPPTLFGQAQGSAWREGTRSASANTFN